MKEVFDEETDEGVEMAVMEETISRCSLENIN